MFVTKLRSKIRRQIYKLTDMKIVKTKLRILLIIIGPIWGLQRAFKNKYPLLQEEVNTADTLIKSITKLIVVNHILHNYINSIRCIIELTKQIALDNVLWGGFNNFLKIVPFRKETLCC